MIYQERAKIILRDSIKSAIYIDDNAKMFYQTEVNNAPEEKLSEDLYHNFKSSGISLEVFKYVDGMELEEDISFITDNRDLVILDWNLKGKGGELESLKILQRIIDTKHIHFCSIYTVEPNLDDVIKNIVTFFSEMDEEEFYNVKEFSEVIFGETFNYEKFHKLNFERDYIDSGRLLGEIYKENKKNIDEFKKTINIKDNKCAIIKASIVNLLNKPLVSEKKIKCPSHIDLEKKIVVINNTIITILNKTENQPDKLLENFINHIISDVDSFNQLLGIELYNSLFRTSVIVNDSIMSFSKNALLYHRKSLKDADIGHFFKNFMDEVLLEKISVSLRDRVSLLLDDSFLDVQEADLPTTKNEKELQKMNVFYNSLVLDKKGKIINFGDVFKVEGEERYLICITPLCDCLRPQSKIRSNFYFVEGENISLSEALKLGDTAFVSYLSNNTNIRWTNKNNNEYGPLYIKPWQYKILEGGNVISEQDQIIVHYLNRVGEKKEKLLNYIGTIRPNYTQRIANHAFSYPIRVGVDFVKI